ncbi:glycosyl hydrolase family 28-related protein [Paenibacillus lautus]|uniref:glycosyl hydrolase family 28-related protein n=1 Tax=Paenibacillus lautus TaxID=1401 RepID=UPI001C7CDE4D|nr:glycosyl hydrolase family 28-related protein [Paenibacillus lautus]MBX4147495.1 hypothetical protein [Paenibacillus lautus]
MSAFDYLRSTITQYRAGTSDDPYIDITESRKVIKAQIQLNEIPVFTNKVKINSMFEVPPTDTSDLKENEYRVDYIEGIISFHPSAEGKMVTATYKGRGNHFVSAARVWTHEENGDVKQTLQDVTDAASNFLYSGVYSPTTQYNTYNIVRYLGSSYICIKETKGNDPTSTEYWSLLSGYNFLGTYSSQTSYSNGDVVVDENNYKMLQSKTDNNQNNPLTDETNWQLLLDLTSVVTEANTATQSANVAAQNANTATQEANQATQDTITAINNADIATSNANSAATTANTAATSANNLVDTFVSKGQYSSATTYSVNNIVLYNGSSWRCIKASQGNTPSEGEFWTLVAIKGVDGQGAVSTVNGLSPDQSGNISLTADEIGAETPAGAQAKVDALAGQGNTKTVKEIDDEIGLLSDLQTTEKNSLVGAINECVEILESLPLNVKDFGAVGDGVTDDTLAIQAAFNATDIGGIVEFENNKTYLVSSELQSRKNIRIRGNGATIITNFSGVGMRLQGNLRFNRSVTADYVKGTPYITMGDVTGISVGDLVSVRSSILFNTSRAHYYRGGNCIVTRISGNNVYLSMTFPFDMTVASLTADGTIGVFIYEPLQVEVQDLTLIHSGTLPQGTIGILAAYTKNSVIRNVNVDNFVSCIEVNRCVNMDIDRVKTGRSYYAGTITSYGIVNKSCTNVRITNTVCSSGIAGFDSGGAETVFGTVCENCSFSSESGSYGLGMHENSWSASFRNCQITGLKLSGNCVLENCTIGVYAGINNYMYLGIGDRYEDNSYTFKDCDFLNGTFRLSGDHQLDALTRIYLGGIHFENCRGLSAVYLDLELTYGSAITANIEKLTFDRCDGLQLTINDNVRQLVMRDLRLATNARLINQLTNKAKLERIILENVGIAENNRSILLKNFGRMVMENCYSVSSGATSRIIEVDSADAVVIMNNCMLSPIQLFVTNAISALYTNQTPVTFSGTSLSKITTKQAATYATIT